MTTRSSSLLSWVPWVPRLAGVAVALFLALFALDAFNNRPFLAALPGFVIHLVPSFMVLAAVALAWRFPLAGAVAFPLLALVYAERVHWRLDWVRVVGGPLVLVGLLFLLSWRANARSA
jgi:hypothetical protein